MRMIRRVLGVLVALPILFYGGAALILNTIDRTALIQSMAQQIAVATGRNVSVGGESKVTLWPIPGITVRQLAIANAEWADDPSMLSAQWVTAAPAPFSLISGELTAGIVVFEEAEVLIERSANGEWNWPLPSGERFAGAPGLYRLESSEIVIRDHDATQPRALRGVDAWLNFSGADAPLSLWGSGEFREAAVDFDLEMDTAGGLANASGANVDLQAETEQEQISFSGHLGRAEWDLSTDITGTLEFATGDLPKTLRWIGVETVSPVAKAITRLSGKARIDSRTERLNLRLNADADASGELVTLDFSAKAGTGWRQQEPASVRAVLRGGGLFSAYLEGPYAGDRLTGPFSLSVLDLDRFKRFAALDDLGFSLAGDTAQLNGDAVVAAELLRLDDARLQISDATYDGSAEMTLSGDRTRLSLSTDLEDLPLAALPSDAPQKFLALLDRISTDLELAVRAKTASLADFAVNDLDGILRVAEQETSIEVRSVNLGAGTAKANLALDRDWQEWTGEFSLEALDLRGFPASTYLPELSGNLDLFGKASGNGNPGDPESLQAKGNMSISDGTFVGLDLGALSSGRGRGQQETRFDLLSSDLALEFPVLRLTNLVVLGQDHALSGAGEVTIPAGELRFELTPTSASDSSARGLRIGGTLGSPSAEVLPRVAVAAPQTEGAPAQDEPRALEAGQPEPEQAASEPAAPAAQNDASTVSQSAEEAAATANPTASALETATTDAGEASQAPTDGGVPDSNASVPLPVPAPR